MKDDNSKVPVAVLSCFLIAFILQGALKLCGVLVFEKALDWQIFTIIDNHKWVQVIYYSLIACLTVYCLSLSLTTICYSKKWWHYAIIFGASILITTIRMFAKYTAQQNILFDIMLYISVPFIITLTTNKKYRLFNHFNVFNVVLTLTIHIALYFCYLGLTYWSNLLTSLYPVGVIWLNSSTMFLINFEIYIGLLTFMLSMNVLIQKMKENYIMNMPVNIASKKAKLTVKKEVLEKKLAKINAEIAEMEAKENAK